MSETEKTQETDTDFKPSEAVPEVDPETVDVIDPEAAEVAEAADGADDDEALDEAEDASALSFSRSRSRREGSFGDGPEIPGSSVSSTSPRSKFISVASGSMTSTVSGST